MRRFAPLMLLAAILPAIAAAQAGAPDPRVLDYPTSSLFLPETPGVTAGALGGLFNPAAWGVGAMGRSELAAWMHNGNGFDRDRFDWGVATSGLLGPGALGLGVVNQEFPVYYEDEMGSTMIRVHRVTNWQLGFAGGGRAVRTGLAYRWTTGDDDLLPRENAIVAGTLVQAGRRISLGASGAWSTASAARQGVFDLGIRPLGTPLITLFADYTLNQRDRLDDGRWGAGLAVRPINGVQLGLSAREMVAHENAEILLHVGITSVGFMGIDHVLRDDSNTMGVIVRFNPPIRGGRHDLGRSGKTFAVVDLENRYVTYQKYRWLDDRRVAWLDLLRYLDAIAADPRVGGVVLNLADLQIRPSLAWELRRELADLKSRGKEIVVFTHRVDFMGYYLASVADRLVLDPEGDVALQGVALRRTYLKTMLEKLGVGFQELKFFDYKSAMETFSQTEMSDFDREQRQRVVDVIYQTARDAICESRHLTPAQFEALVNGDLGFWPELARQRGLVDEISRWDELKRGLRLGGPSPAYAAGAFPEAQWGQPPRVAVVYAVGGCDMDSGIKGRKTSAYLRQLVRDPTVAAVVLRADSPGGDPLPSDLVAGAVRDLRAAGKPVIVSQGDVAASGGYWISMDGQQILTTPLTITGSIGVIGGWFWAENFGQKYGITSDGVKAGEHADLLATVRVPILNEGLPARPLDAPELDLARGYILNAYGDFVAKVAKGRGLTEDAVREVAQGRVWMGEDAIARGLCDRVGTLSDAIALAREAAGIGENLEVEVVEYPPRPLVDLSGLLGRGGGLPGFPFGLLEPLARLWRAGTAAPADGEPPEYLQVYLQSLASRPGRGAVVVSPESLPEGWNRLD